MSSIQVTAAIPFIKLLMFSQDISLNRKIKSRIDLGPIFVGLIIYRLSVWNLTVFFFFLAIMIIFMG